MHILAMIVVAIALVVPGEPWAQPKEAAKPAPKEAAKQAPKEAALAPAKISAMAWMKGYWAGEGYGGRSGGRAPQCLPPRLLPGAAAHQRGHADLDGCARRLRARGRKDALDASRHVVCDRRRARRLSRVDVHEARRTAQRLPHRRRR